MVDEQKEAELDFSKQKLEEQNNEDKETLRMSKISLILDNYNDIFSDFDPRSYNERAISKDFLFEAKSAAREKSLGIIELSLLVPKNLRNESVEAIIKKRLREHFKKHNEEVHKEIKKIKRKGIRFILAGVSLGFIATLISAVLDMNAILKSGLLTLLEPASWFTIWNGLDNLFFIPFQIKEELKFYEKMVKATITFQGY